MVLSREVLDNLAASTHCMRTGACLTYWAKDTAARRLLNYAPIFTPNQSFHRTLAYYRHHPDFPPGSYPTPPPSSLAPTPLPPRPIAVGARERAWTRFRNYFTAILVLLLLMRCQFTASTPWQPLPLTHVTSDPHAAFALLTDFRRVYHRILVQFSFHTRLRFF